MSDEDKGTFDHGVDTLTELVEEMSNSASTLISQLTGVEKARFEYQMSLDSAMLTEASLRAAQAETANLLALMNSAWFTDVKARLAVKDHILDMMGIRHMVGHMTDPLDTLKDA